MLTSMRFDSSTGYQICTTMYFYYNPKNSLVYMIKSVQHAKFFRRANDSAGWQPLTFEAFKELRPLSESKKMKDSDWKSRYFWELPYGEGYKFKEWLKVHYHATNYSFFIKGYNMIQINFSYTHNEVNEPYLDCESYLSKNVLQQVCDLIMRFYENWED